VPVFGVSFDSVDENRAFAEKFEYPFPLLCDTSRAMGLAYGACEAADAQHARRYTYVVGEDGKILHAIDTQDPGAQADELLRALKG